MRVINKTYYNISTILDILTNKMESGIINLKSLLKKRGLTLYQLCQDTGLSYQQGFAIANNKTKKIEFQTIERICGYLSCEVSELINIRSKFKGKDLKSIILNFEPTSHAKRICSSENSGDIKPFLQWVGGKRGLLDQYEKIFPRTYGKYFEPFLGGGAMFFHLKANGAILNDSNPELIFAYEGVRDYPNEVIVLLKILKERHSLDLYQAIRNLDRDINILSSFKKYEVAARMIYLNQTCFNGVYRVNKHGQFNVPIGSSLNRLICDEWTILNASKLLKGTNIYCADFENVLEKAKKGDFVYLDPPYFPISEYSDFTRYTKEKFYQADQERLKVMFDSLNKKGCKVMLSNSNSDFIKNLYDSYHIHTVYSGRTLNSKKDRRGKISELVITNYKP